VLGGAPHGPHAGEYLGDGYGQYVGNGFDGYGNAPPPGPPSVRVLPTVPFLPSTLCCSLLSACTPPQVTACASAKSSYQLTLDAIPPRRPTIAAQRTRELPAAFWHT